MKRYSDITDRQTRQVIGRQTGTRQMPAAQKRNAEA